MHTTDWLLLVLLSVLWGAAFFFIAVANPYLPPLTLVLMRVGLAAMALVPVVLLIGERLPSTLAGWWPFAVQAALNNVIPFTLIVYGQRHVTSGLAAVLNATTPLFTLVVARLFAREPLSANKLAGVLIGVAGVGVLVGPEALGADAASAIGMLCILGAAISYGVSALWMRRLRQVPPVVTATAQLISSSAMLLPLAGAVERFWLLPLPAIPVLLAVLGLALFSTALAFIVFFRINASAGPANAMLVTLLVPVTATLLGVMILDEALTPHQLAGALVVACGLLVIDGRPLAWLIRRDRPA